MYVDGALTRDTAEFGVAPLSVVVVVVVVVVKMAICMLFCECRKNSPNGGRAAKFIP